MAESALERDEYRDDPLTQVRLRDYLPFSGYINSLPPDPYASTAPSASAADAPNATSGMPRDEVWLAPGQSGGGFTKMAAQPLGEQAAGIYGTPRSTPAGDVVIPSPGQNKTPSALDFIPDYNREVIWDNPRRRMYDDLMKQHSLGNLPEGNNLEEFVTKQGHSLGDILRGFSSQDPSYLTRASYAGDVLSPYATGNARLGQPSSVEGVKDIFADRIKTMVGDMPPNIAQKFGIISGFRDAARQHEVNPRVTNSRHMYGMAVDTVDDPDVLNWINNTNGKYGVDYTLRHLPGEQNHLEMVENGVRAPLSSGNAPAQPTQPTQPPSAAAADRTQEVATDQLSQLHPVFAYEAALEQFPVLHSQQLISGPGKQLEYWPPNEPGTPDRPRPDYIPIDQAGMELGPNATPMDILGDIVSHHMVKKDPVIKKHYESFKNSLTGDQKEQLQAQYNYAAKNQNETRPYAAWEKSTGLPAYFRGYAFGQWPAEFNQKAYTPAQRYHFDRMMDYLRGNTHMQPPSALQ